MMRGFLGLLLSSAALVALFTGCATPPAPSGAAVFYPPPPGEPRLQYLTSFSEAADLEAPPGWLMRFLTGARPPRAVLTKPYGVAMALGRLYVCDTVTSSVLAFDLAAREATRLVPDGASRLQTPIGVAAAADGRLYIADAGRGEIVVLLPNGRPGGVIASDPPMRPTGLAVDGEYLYVSDLAARAVHVYARLEMRRLHSIDGGTNAATRLFGPTNVAVAPDGTILVSDTGAFRVQCYSASGDWLRSIGEHGDAPGQFARNKGVAVDRAGRAYVVDAAAQLVQVFGADGRLLTYFGEPGGSPAALNLPAGICIDYDHVQHFQAYVAEGFEVEYLVIVSNQYGPRRVSIYGYGRRIETVDDAESGAQG